ncbi:MAG: threonine--tRNA ligase [Pseudomonadota bacterium]
MPQITLPDGSLRSYEQAISVYDIAADIGAGLAKATLAGKVNGQLVDAAFVIHDDSQLQIITSKDEDGLEVIRHSTAHLMAQAVQSLFPGTQVTIGPVIEDGFFYDFSYKESFTPDNLLAIEKKMSQLVKENLPISRQVKSRNEAVDFFKQAGEEYKAEIIQSIPVDEDLSLYTQGEFTDLCRGPHVPSTGKLKVFKLMKLAGAYWRGDSNNEMLQRIYGTAWANKKDLKDYLFRLAEAEKRDHRKIGKQLDFFHMQEEAPGMVFWHDKGWTIYQEVEQYVRKVLKANNYQEIRTPQVVDRSLWEKSGHWDKFGDMMFTTHSENRDYAIKPMNCPCHIQVFNKGLKSYRDLPLRMAEFGSCHRNEPSGTLHGLMRVRNFVQDDAHIFCTEAQIQDEISAFIDLLYEVYADFGFTQIIVKLSTRPEQRVGSDEVWDKAETALQASLDAKEMDWELQPGEGAFYGPKIEFSLKDCLGRIWQCGTAQVDFSMPGRLDASYIDEHGEKQTPVMIHRAILGSMERFIGILIEEHAGKLPLWLSPVQVVVSGISEKQAEYVKKVAKKLQQSNIRVESDLRNEKIGFKIREHTLNRIPYIFVAGAREVEANTIAVRTREGEDLGTMAIDDLIDHLQQQIDNKS